MRGGTALIPDFCGEEARIQAIGTIARKATIATVPRSPGRLPGSGASLGPIRSRRVGTSRGIEALRSTNAGSAGMISRQ